ncbi:MAG TPA: tetratricopeptide repeat protein [Kofleriaceae bacterium]|nr:tetratricopeptide repeat protein [Kofleriaceae bacterium]
MVLVGGLFSAAIADGEIARPRDPQARERLTAGTRLYRLREFEKAIDEYKAGALREDAPVFYFNLGQCYRQLGRYEDAIWHYQRFLDRADPAPAKYRTAVEAFVRDMRAELDKQAMKRQPTEPAGDNPLREEPTQAAAPPSVANTGKQLRPPPWHADGSGWGLTGVGAIGMGASLYLLLDARSLEDDANREPSQQRRDELRADAGDRRLAATIVGAVGVAALITGIVKLAITESANRANDVSGLRVAPTTSGIVVMGSF